MITTDQILMNLQTQLNSELFNPDKFWLMNILDTSFTGAINSQKSLVKFKKN